MPNTHMPTSQEILALPDQAARSAHLKQFGFVITDMSEGVEQYVRTNDEHNFDVINETITRELEKEYRLFMINLLEYSHADLRRYVEPYYGGLQELADIVTDPTARNMLIAEMIAEELCINEPN